MSGSTYYLSALSDFEQDQMATSISRPCYR